MGDSPVSAKTPETVETFHFPLADVLNFIGGQIVRAGTSLKVHTSGISERFSAFCSKSLPSWLSGAKEAVFSAAAEKKDNPHAPAILAMIRKDTDPGNEDRVKNQMGSVAVGQDGTLVCECWALDVNRADNTDFTYNNEPLNSVKQNSRAIDNTKPGQFPRVVALNDELGQKGIASADVTRLTEFSNQNTLGAFLQTEVAPGVGLSDGSKVPLVTDFSKRSWEYTPTDRGYNVSFEGTAPLTAIPAGDQNILFGEGSSAKLKFTIVLKRDEAGTLQLDEIKGFVWDVRAFTSTGAPAKIVQ